MVSGCKDPVVAFLIVMDFYLRVVNSKHASSGMAVSIQQTVARHSRVKTEFPPKQPPAADRARTSASSSLLGGGSPSHSGVLPPY
ncbi:hypothetical protein RRG08_042434 [Elysia crispata]|uniref:Uncharacterized protein n=1 Tax=Elysia crispata TaxID=231223 RepID=A0AAE0ZD17_9GAST|nr:hypothetical protein RRG08_042434 [Elysia crispata]